MHPGERPHRQPNAPRRGRQGANRYTKGEAIDPMYPAEPNCDGSAPNHRTDTHSEDWMDTVRRPTVVFGSERWGFEPLRVR